MYEQVYLKDDIVFDVGDDNIDHFYFVMEGMLRVEAKVTVDLKFKFPVDKSTWEKQTKTYTVLYLVKELRPGDFFGLESLVEAGELRIAGKERKAREVKR